MSDIFISAAGYRAIIRTHMGANCISLTHAPTRANVLRTPESEGAHARDPNTYGMPFLFPPNRVRDGKFTYDGAIYTFPINEPERNHHIHGVLSALPFDVDWRREDAVACSYRATLQNPYLAFPHEFSAQITYSLSDEGLCQTLNVINDSSAPMPLGVGFHTTFNVPFIEGARAEDIALSVSCDKIYEYDARIIPTGKTRDAAAFSSGVRAVGAPISHLLSMPRGANRAHISDEARGVRIVYDVDAKYRYWMLFNKGGGAGFICAEPQSWIVDAPNLDWNSDITGFRALAPREITKFVSRIRVEHI